MDVPAVLEAIVRLRQAMPRNADAMLICDTCEPLITPFDRKAYMREYMREYMRKHRRAPGFIVVPKPADLLPGETAATYNKRQRAKAKANDRITKDLRARGADFENRERVPSPEQPEPAAVTGVTGAGHAPAPILDSVTVSDGARCAAPVASGEQTTGDIDRAAALKLAARKVGRLMDFDEMPIGRVTPCIGFLDREMTRREVVALIGERQRWRTCFMGAPMWVQRRHWYAIDYPGRQQSAPRARRAGGVTVRDDPPANPPEK